MPLSDPNEIAQKIPDWIDLEMGHAVRKYRGMNRLPLVESALRGGLKAGQVGYNDLYNYLGRVEHARELPIEGNFRLTQAMGKFMTVTVTLHSVLDAEILGLPSYVEAYHKQTRSVIARHTPHFDGRPETQDFTKALDTRLWKIAEAVEHHDLDQASLRTRELLLAQTATYVGHIVGAGVWAAPGLPSGELKPWDAV